MKFNSQSGIAMVVVLLVAAVLTVTASTAAFLTVRDFGSAADDRRGSQALAYAEAAIDRTIGDIEGGRWVWKQVVSSGCPDATLTARGLSPDDYPLFVGASVGAAVGAPLEAGTGGDIGNGGRYRGVLTGCLGSGASFPRPTGSHELTIRAIGEHPTARREILQTIEVAPKGLPVGLYASTEVRVNGEGDLRSVNLVSPGPILGRDQITFVGLDPFYEKSDFYPCTSTNVPTGCFAEDGNDVGDMPASAHSGALITCQSNCPRGSSRINNNREHPAASDGIRSPNCDANKRLPGAHPQAGQEIGQSLWDGDDWTEDAALGTITANTCGWSVPPIPAGSPAWQGNTYPSTSIFTDEDARRLAPAPQLSEDDLAALRARAQTSGIYCGTELSATGAFSCHRNGGPAEDMSGSDGVRIDSLVDIPNIFVAYIDFPAGASERLLEWAADMSVGGVRACAEPPNHRSATLVVRNGDVNGGGNIFFNGTVIANEGEVDLDGNFKINGTVIARTIELIGGADITLDACWVNNMQTSRIDVTTLGWSEIDR